MLIVQSRIPAAQRQGGRTRWSAILEILGALLAAALLATLVWSGHAHASNKHAWLLPTDLLHVIAAGAWPGGLLPLALLLGLSLFALSLGVIGLVWVDRFRTFASSLAIG